MPTDAPTHGHAAGSGSPAKGISTSETSAAPIEISTVVASGSSAPLMAAFQPAWQAAANSTAAKTTVSMGPTRDQVRVPHQPAYGEDAWHRCSADAQCPRR